LRPRSPRLRGACGGHLPEPARRAAIARPSRPAPTRPRRPSAWMPPPSRRVRRVGGWSCGRICRRGHGLHDPQLSVISPELFLVAEHQGRIVATVIGGFDCFRGWIYHLAVTSGERRAGVGRAMMAEVEKRLRNLGCAKINLQVRSSNDTVIQFYRDLGYSVEDRVSMGKPLNETGAGSSPPSAFPPRVGLRPRCRLAILPAPG